MILKVLLNTILDIIYQKSGTIKIFQKKKFEKFKTITITTNNLEKNFRLLIKIIIFYIEFFIIDISKSSF